MFPSNFTGRFSNIFKGNAASPIRHISSFIAFLQKQFRCKLCMLWFTMICEIKLVSNHFLETFTDVNTRSVLATSHTFSLNHSYVALLAVFISKPSFFSVLKNHEFVTKEIEKPVNDVLRLSALEFFLFFVLLYQSIHGYALL